MIDISSLLLGIIAFIAGAILIIWGADATLDVIEDISKKLKLSPIILAVFVLGVDLEETITAIITAAKSLENASLGNLIGNSIISISFIMAIPGLFQTISYKNVNSRVIIIFGASIIVLLLSFILPIPIWIMGIFSLLLYFFYIHLVIDNGKKKSNFGVIQNQEIIINNKSQEKNDNSINANPKKEKKIYWMIIKGIVGLIALFFGSELLSNGIVAILDFSMLTESIMGLVIIAFLTNFDEFIILFISIKRKKIDIGLNTLVGKLIWNSCITFSIVSFILGNIIKVNNSILINAILLLVIIYPIFCYAAIGKKKMNYKIALPLLVAFAIYLGVSIIFQMYLK